MTAYAYAYEIDDTPLVSDPEYDAIALRVNPDQATGNDLLDRFFRAYYEKYTGSWIYMHPELLKVKALVARVRTARNAAREETPA